MATVYISHSSDTAAESRRLAEALAAKDLSVWLDEWQLPPGAAWTEEIEKGLSASQCIVVVIGPQEERDTRVRNEWSAVLSEKWAHDRKRLVPVLVGDAVLPPFLSRWRYLRTNGDWELVATEIDAAMRGRSTALEGEPAEAAVYRERAREAIRDLKAQVAASAGLAVDLQLDETR